MPDVRCPDCRLRQEGQPGDACVSCDTPVLPRRDTSERFRRVAAFMVAERVLEARGERAVGRSVLRSS